MQATSVRKYTDFSAFYNTATLAHDGRKYRVSIETIGPEEAKMYVGTTQTNRKVSKHNVNKLVGAIKRGEWMLNGETIVFDDAGHLIQGQHRMRAVIESGVSITVFVVRGVVADAFRSMDDVMRRSAPQILEMGGKTHGNVVSSAARAYILLTQGSVAKRDITNQQIVSMVDEKPAIYRWAKMCSNKANLKFMPSSFAGVLAVAAEKHGDEIIMVFAERVCDGVGLERDDPAYVLREKFRGLVRGQVFSSVVAISYMVKAVNAWTHGKRMKNLRMLPDEGMPEVI